MGDNVHSGQCTLSAVQVLHHLSQTITSRVKQHPLDAMLQRVHQQITGVYVPTNKNHLCSAGHARTIRRLNMGNAVGRQED